MSKKKLSEKRADEKESFIEIKRWLKSAREKKGWTRARVANSAGKTRAWLEGWENGRIHSISAEDMILLAKSLEEPLKTVLDKLIDIWRYEEEEATEIYTSTIPLTVLPEEKSQNELLNYHTLMKTQQKYLPPETLIIVISSSEFPAATTHSAIRRIMAETILYKKFRYSYLWSDCSWPKDCQDNIFFSDTPRRIQDSFDQLKDFIRLEVETEEEKNIIMSKLNGHKVTGKNSLSLAMAIGLRRTMEFYCKKEGQEYRLPESGAIAIRPPPKNPLLDDRYCSQDPNYVKWSWLSHIELNEYGFILQDIFRNEFDKLTPDSKKTKLMDK